VTECDADVAAARSGDEAARDRVLRDVWPRAFRLSASIVGDRETAEEAAQDALVLIATRLGSLRDAQAFPLWSARIIVNAARSALRKRPRERDLPPERAPGAFDNATVERLDVLSALAALPEWLRVPLVLRYVEGLNSREIGTALGAPSATIRFRLALGRRRLATALGDDDPTAREEYA
jgi:RNA polymerase sigma-70 factor (ECF subfamily)